MTSQQWLVRNALNLNFNKLFRPVEALFGGFWMIF